MFVWHNLSRDKILFINIFWGREHMNSLLQDGLMTEIESLSNIAYILQDESFFVPTEYKVLRNSNIEQLVSCVKMLFNGKVELYYLTQDYKPLTSQIRRLNADDFLTVIGSYLSAVNVVQGNGFLSVRNIDASPEKIFIKQSENKAYLIYVPVKHHLYEDILSFERDFENGIVRLLSENNYLNSKKLQSFADKLRADNISIEGLLSLASECRSIPEVQKPVTEEPSAPKKQVLRLVAMNTTQHFSLLVDKPEYTIGKKESNDGIVTISNAVSRTHCKIITADGLFYVTDLQSANGTFVGGRVVPQSGATLLHHGDILKLADVDFRVIVEEG